MLGQTRHTTSGNIGKNERCGKYGGENYNKNCEIRDTSMQNMAGNNAGRGAPHIIAGK